jgi:predicted 3-demethylubiquinone-9 3-methyltransferase (glyoxalase superfamily)
MAEGTDTPMAAIRPFLMLQGNAEEAMNFYASLFPDGREIELVRYEPVTLDHKKR